MSLQNENASSAGETVVPERPEAGSVYASLFEKINLKPASHLSDINTWQDEAAMAEADVNERITAGVQVFMDCICKSGQQVEKLDKTSIDHHIAELRVKLYAVPHFQVEGMGVNLSLVSQMPKAKA